MKISIQIIELISIFICTVCCLKTVKRLYNGSHSIQNLVYLIVYFFFICPLILQLIFPYSYEIFFKANAALNDVFSVSLYCVFICVFSVLLLKYGSIKKVIVANEFTFNSLTCKISCLIIIFALIYTLITNGLGILFAGYGARLSSSNTYEINETLYNMAMVGALVIIGQYKNVSKKLLLLLSIVFIILIWIHGKRFYIAEFLIMALFVLYITKAIRGETLVITGLILAILIIGYAYFYGAVLKGNTSSLLEYLSIDMSRHYTLIYQFYCKKNNIAISLGKFDAILFLLFFWVPRSVWINKPYPFVNALTRSLMGRPPLNENLGWATTCSIFSDLFDSLTLFGLVLGIILILFLCKRLNKSNSLEFKVIGIYLVVNLLTVQMSASLPTICLCAFIFMVCDLFGKKRKSIRKERKFNAIITRG